MDLTITDINYPNDDHDGFHIYLKVGDGAYQRAMTIQKTETAFTLTDLSENQRNCVRIAAYNSFGFGPMSEEHCAGRVLPLGPPTGTPTFNLIVS